MWADQDSEYFQKCYVPFPDDILCMVPFAGDVYLTNRQGSVLCLTAADDDYDVARRGGRMARSISMSTVVPALGPESVEVGRYYYLVATAWCLTSQRSSEKGWWGIG
ncbi:hypothetical protein U9M48_030653 [Paspalum notatum var. saurae]|uniref:Uncharacterized protein n=1 Tax=Paspalum notatum var. saurae TaxID=547442 RepID=A0AAQ3X3H5_PASNO